MDRLLSVIDTLISANDEDKYKAMISGDTSKMNYCDGFNSACGTFKTLISVFLNGKDD